MTAPSSAAVAPGAGMLGYVLRAEIVSTVAALTGRKANVRFERDDAYTDGKTIVVPELSPSQSYADQAARVLRGYANHECGHIMYTDMPAELPFIKRSFPKELVEGFFLSDERARAEANTPEGRARLGISERDVWIFKTYRALANAIEDWRIEAVLRVEYPGAHANMGATRAHVNERESAMFAANPDREMAMPSAVMTAITYKGCIANAYPCAALAQSNFEFVAARCPQAARHVEDIWPEVLACKTPRDVRELALREARLYADLYYDPQKQSPPPPPRPQPGDSADKAARGDGAPAQASAPPSPGPSPDSTPGSDPSSNQGEDGPAASDAAETAEPSGEPSTDSAADSNDPSTASGDASSDASGDRPDNGPGADAAPDSQPGGDSHDAPGAAATAQPDAAGPAAANANGPAQTFKPAAVDNVDDIATDALDISDVIEAIAQATAQNGPDRDRDYTVHVTTDTASDLDAYAQLIAEAGAAAARTAAATRRALTSQTKRHVRRDLEDGEFDVQNVTGIAVGDSTVYRRMSERRDVSAAAAFVLDHSASMHEVDPGASTNRMQRLAQATAAIASAIANERHVATALMTYTNLNDVIRLRWLKDFGQPGSRLKGAVGAMTHGQYSGTPTTQALLEAYNVIRKRHEPRKVIFLITDGEANDRPSACQAAAAIAAHGVILIGIGIGANAPAMPIPGWLSINNVSELPDRLPEIVRNVLARPA